MGVLRGLSRACGDCDACLNAKPSEPACLKATKLKGVNFEMNGIGAVFFKVLFCFGVGAGIPMLISGLADLLSGSHTVRILVGTTHGMAALIVFGLFGVALAVWDGQFVDDVKPTHWTRRKNPN